MSRDKKGNKIDFGKIKASQFKHRSLRENPEKCLE